MTQSSRSTTRIEDDLISIDMAIIDRCYKLRLAQWPPLDHIEIELSATNALLPWVKLWSQSNMVINTRNPIRVPWSIVWPWMDNRARVWLPYGGPAGTPYDEQSGRDRESESTDTAAAPGDSQESRASAMGRLKSETEAIRDQKEGR